MTASIAAPFVGGCSLPGRLAMLPTRLKTHEAFPGIPNGARVVLDGQDDALLGRIIEASLFREIANLESQGITRLGPADYLALSGGGEDGAFGAGVLTGWTKTGTRPEFRIVTGVSTGALMAPFAYLGSAYDDALTRFYTGITQESVMRSRGYLDALFGDSLYDSRPLQEMIRSALTPNVLDSIAREYLDKGRLLMVATTNLDTPVGVLWNIGALAASGQPASVDLIVQVLLASASIPGAFPPVMIRFEHDGRSYEEMHVDGGALTQVMLYPGTLSLGDIAPSLLKRVVARERRLWIIRNSRMGRRSQPVERSAIRITSRALNTLIATQGVGDLYQLYVLAQRDHLRYRVTYIPGDFAMKPNDLFDPVYMRALFEFGQTYIQSGQPWHDFPPGYSPNSLYSPVR
ncbi:patatin-like phospholipase family protein [uncultured Reyranella sp.]|uniref:patatin-like phospholipase family protein n=1 Tax=uncultured Reyranella sp. TaxID=735512 RepID=UPI0025EF43F6|nr:patatin-like phospholipase family protein [uncultured Reyranella sp.]